MEEIIKNINADAITIEELHAKLDKGYWDFEQGNVQVATIVFDKFRERQEGRFCG